MLCRIRAATCHMPPSKLLSSKVKKKCSKNKPQSRHFKYLIAQHYLAIDGRHSAGGNEGGVADRSIDSEGEIGKLLSISCG